MKMRIKSICFAVVVGLFIVFGGAPDSYGQPNIQMTGAYGDADVKNADVVSAAAFAVKTQSKKQKSPIKLVSLDKARTQVVAGMNYQVCLTVSVKNKSGGKAVKKYAEAIIYKNLKNKYSLTSWITKEDSSGCSD